MKIKECRVVDHPKCLPGEHYTTLTLKREIVCLRTSNGHSVSFEVSEFVGAMRTFLDAVAVVSEEKKPPPLVRLSQGDYTVDIREEDVRYEGSPRRTHGADQ